MTLHEVSALRGHALLEPTEETRNLPPGNLSILLEHLTTLEERGEAKSYIFTPGEIVDGSELMFFVAPPEGSSLSPGIRSLNQFKNKVVANLLIPSTSSHDADYVYKENVSEQIRNQLQNGSLALPSLTFEDEIQVVREILFRVKEARTQDSPATRLLGTARKTGGPEEIYRKTSYRETVKTIMYIYHRSQFAHLVARSVQLLHERREVKFGYSSIFAFRDLVTAFIQDRHAGQIQRGTFRITEPEAYLHALGIPLTYNEAEVIFVQ